MELHNGAGASGTRRATGCGSQGLRQQITKAMATHLQSLDSDAAMKQPQLVLPQLRHQNDADSHPPAVPWMVMRPSSSVSLCCLD